MYKVKKHSKKEGLIQKINSVEKIIKFLDRISEEKNNGRNIKLYRRT